MPTNTRELVARARRAAVDERDYAAKGGHASLLDELATALEQIEWDSEERTDEERRRDDG